MGLSLVVGPAHAGKVALLLDRFEAALDRDPWLIVPNRVEVDRIERELAARRGALLAGTVGTFDTLFAHLAGTDPDARTRLLGDAERAILLRRVVADAHLEQLAPSARFAGFTDALAAAFSEIEAGLLDPVDLGEELAALIGAYRTQLEAIGACDRGMLRRRAVTRLTGTLGAWAGAPVFAYGFEDLTGAEWRLLEALAARGEVHVSLPYEPGRPVFASLSRTVDDLAALAVGDLVELDAGSAEYLPAGLAHLERQLFDDTVQRAPLDGSIRFLEGAGRRATLELVAEQVLDLVRGGMPAEAIAVVCPSLERLRPSLEAAFGGLGVPLAFEARPRLAATVFGQALLSLLRFSWSNGTRRELFAFLRTPYSGLGRSDVDFLEGRLRGRAVLRGDRIREELPKLRNGRPLPVLDLVEAEPDSDPLSAARVLSQTMLRNAYGLGAPPVSPAARRDLRAADAVAETLDELTRLSHVGVPIGSDDVLAALDRATTRGDGAGEPGKVAVLDLSRVRTRRFDAVFVVGLEQGSLPRRAPVSPFFDDETRRRLDERGHRLERPDTASRDRYLFYTACTRPRKLLALVREAATDEGSPREPSPFWESVAELFDADAVRTHTTRRPLSRLTWPVELAPSDRERLRALARLSATDPREAEALAFANGWQRKLGRARRAFVRPTELRHPRAIALLGNRETFRVTDLERMAGCSSAWFVERYLRPGTIDQAIDAKMRGSIAHVALQRFYSRLPGFIPGAERVTGENVEDAVRLMHECVEDAMGSGLRIDADDLERRELGQGLQRDLEQFVRSEAVAASSYVPEKLEYSFRAYELAPGVAVSGKIDRVDRDPVSARGIVVDYKSGAAPSATQIHDEARLQIPLYMLVLRDEIGVEPMGGVYVPFGGGRRARGMLRKGPEEVVGFAPGDYLEDDAFEAEIEHARETAVALAGRIRAGDVRHDPRGGECPAWCDLWRMCRKERA